MYMIQTRILMFQILVVIRYMTIHDTHYIIINPNYYKYVSFYYVWNQIQILSDTDTIFDTYMIQQLTDTNTHLFIMFGQPEHTVMSQGHYSCWG